MERDVSDDLERRLRAARPQTARVDESAFDPDLLEHVRGLPVASRRSVPRAVALPVAAGVTLTATAVVMLGGGPGDVGGPPSAAAIGQALRWLNPGPGTILHTRSVEKWGNRTTTRELWQSADDPDSRRLRTEGAQTYETSGDGLYDPATDTIYDVPGGLPEPRDEKIPGGDPVVAKVRILLKDERMVVTGPVKHGGTDAWAISLKSDYGRPVWTLWVSKADGRPLELRDPGRDAREAPQVIRWPTYEVLPDDDADRLLTLTGAHPSARVVDDPEQVGAAERRLDVMP
jgi:hypothetical protein